MSPQNVLESSRLYRDSDRKLVETYRFFSASTNVSSGASCSRWWAADTEPPNMTTVTGLGFGRVVASEIEVPIILVNLV